MNPARLSLVDWTVLLGTGIKGFLWLSGVYISLIKNSDLELGIFPFCALDAFYQSAVYAKLRTSSYNKLDALNIFQNHAYRHMFSQVHPPNNAALHMNESPNGP
jgi:hypothetical protein